MAELPAYGSQGGPIVRTDLVDTLRGLVDHEPRRGVDLAEMVGGEPEDVFEVLVWMEARGIVAMRPLRGSRLYGFSKVIAG